MRLLADENMPGGAVAALRAAGHDVAWVRETAAGIPDTEVLEWAIREARILVTFDKDFGELSAGAPLPSACGVILLRIAMQPPLGAPSKIADLIDARSDWAGHFSVVEPGRLRMRLLSAPPQS